MHRVPCPCTPRCALPARALAGTVRIRRSARRRHTSEFPERARLSGLSGRCLAAQTRRARGPARARGRLGRGGGARSPPATRAALRPARGVCTGGGPAGPMFTELRTKLSPPRGRSGAVRAGFGERRDVDGERAGPGRGSIGVWGLKDREGQGRVLADSEWQPHSEWGARPGRTGSRVSLSCAGAGVGWGRAVRPWESARLGLGEVTRSGSCPQASSTPLITFSFARRKPSPAPAVGPRGGRDHSGTQAPPPHFPTGNLTLGLEGGTHRWTDEEPSPRRGQEMGGAKLARDRWQRPPTSPTAPGRPALRGPATQSPGTPAGPCSLGGASLLPPQ